MITTSTPRLGRGSAGKTFSGSSPTWTLALKSQGIRSLSSPNSHGPPLILCWCQQLRPFASDTSSTSSPEGQYQFACLAGQVVERLLSSKNTWSRA